ncbi:MAG: nucleotide exchange factor GrpE, partial [Limisphaerales bacterium]
EIPEPESVEAETAETPDLCSFYEQLAAATAESRKTNRRTAEAISQWGDTLSRFDNSLLPLRETVAQLLAAQPKGTELSREHCIVLAEWLDRLNRIKTAFRAPPAKTSWWGGNDRLWRKTWETQQQAMAIVVSHIEEFLKKEGVTRVETVGHLFDPSTMNAVAAEPDPNRPPQTILEELAAGYRRHGELLRPAQVKVSRQP